jgi:nicotinate-nucleotide pyrophosphorylase (carboxylating)
MNPLTPTPHLDALLDLALAEDIGTGDVTTRSLISSARIGTMNLVAREGLVFCGAPVGNRLLQRFGDDSLEISWLADEGETVEPNARVGVVTGRLEALLVVERTLLNFLQRMSGVATFTRRFVDAIEGTNARIIDTRKTMPGFRLLDKYATRAGGAVNHRSALDGGVLIKDNHLEAAGGVANAVRQARAKAPHSLTIEVEVESLEGLDAALDAGADVVMLDNFSAPGVAEAVERAAGRALIEASGGIVLNNVRSYAEAGADLIAIGALTHSARAVDLAGEVSGD